jgi:hypothetical protein
VCAYFSNTCLECNRKQIPKVLTVAYALEKKWFNGVFLEQLLKVPSKATRLSSDLENKRALLIECLASRTMISAAQLQAYKQAIEEQQQREQQQQQSDAQPDTSADGEIANNSDTSSLSTDPLERLVCALEQWAHNAAHSSSSSKSHLQSSARSLRSEVREFLSAYQQPKSRVSADANTAHHTSELVIEKWLDTCRRLYATLACKEQYIEYAVKKLMRLPSVSLRMHVVLLRHLRGTASSAGHKPWLFCPQFYGFMLAAITARISDRTAHFHAWNAINQHLISSMMPESTALFAPLLAFQSAFIEQLSIQGMGELVVLPIDPTRLPPIRLPTAATATVATTTTTTTNSSNVTNTTNCSSSSSSSCNSSTTTNAACCVYLPEICIAQLLWLRGYLHAATRTSGSQALAEPLEHLLATLSRPHLQRAIRTCQPLAFDKYLQYEAQLDTTTQLASTTKACTTTHDGNGGHDTQPTTHHQPSTLHQITHEQRVAVVRQWVLEYYVPMQFEGNHHAACRSMIVILTLWAMQHPHASLPLALRSVLLEMVHLTQYTLDSSVASQLWLLDILDSTCSTLAIAHPEIEPWHTVAALATLLLGAESTLLGCANKRTHEVFERTAMFLNNWLAPTGVFQVPHAQHLARFWLTALLLRIKADEHVPELKDMTKVRPTAKQSR